MASLATRAAALSSQDAASIVRLLHDFLLENPQAQVLEDGRVLFDLQLARFSLTAERGRCLWHLWSEERNLVRTVSSVRERKNSLRIETVRLGQSKPQVLELVSGRDRCAPSTRRILRERFLRVFERLLCREFPECAIDSLIAAPDLENSFGPGYVRGLLRRGQTAWAVIAAGPEESPATIDGILTLGILWLAWCRAHGNGRTVLAGLKIFVPEGQEQLTRRRLAWLHPRIASWELYAVDAKSEGCCSVSPAEIGLAEPRLLHAFNPAAAIDRCQSGLDRLSRLMPPGLREVAEVRANSPAEVSLALHGLEFARVRQGFSSHSFAPTDEITFGAGANETPLTDETEALFCDLIQQLGEHRRAGNHRRNPLYRLQPERWLESVLRRNLEEIDTALCPGPIYTQVAAMGTADRGLLDLLAVTRSGRLAIVEVKADDDLQLPLQSLDYWARVRELQQQGSLTSHGYFQGMELSATPPLLYLVSPILRVHPATDTVLAHLSPEIPWQVVGVGEDWKTQLRVIARKKSEGWASRLSSSI
ncbi:hypothetical protein [Silvibacterium dinghuense]|uniref:hypothetical protein n=1 Tax=Silvibacterium dinghuense TaxID=1560006 RepID=UPI001E57ABE7|nr:hypothetical protein [Silvibacterium dinghuense]